MFWEHVVNFVFCSKVHSEHLSTLVCQLLTQEGLSLSWENTIMQTTNMITKLVSPDVRNEGDDMDIRKYVQIKKVKLSDAFSPGERFSFNNKMHNWSVLTTFIVPKRKMLPIICQWWRGYSEWENFPTLTFFPNHLLATKLKISLKHFEGMNSFFFYQVTSLSSYWFINSQSNENLLPHCASFFFLWEFWLSIDLIK